MSAAFEQDSILTALTRAGLFADQNANTAPSEATSIYFAWSDREILLLRPEYAWLTIADVKYVRLPQPLEVLRREIAEHLNVNTHKAEWEALSNPVRQWQWAVNKAAEAIREGKFRGADLRFVELRRFALKQWPGWFEEPLANLREKVEAGYVSSQDIHSLGASVVSVARLHACDSLLSWATGERCERILSLRDAACYATQGLLGAEEFENLAAIDPWWDELEADLSRAVTALESVNEFSGTDEHLDRCLDGIEKSLARIKGYKAGEQINTETFTENYLAIDTLLRSLNSIVSLHNRILNALKARR